MAEPFRLTERDCRYCQALGCDLCWYTGKVEVQRGPQDQAREVPDPADLGITRAINTGWVTDWYGEGEVFIP